MTDTVAEITATFRERALMYPQYVADWEIKKTGYHDMLREHADQQDIRGYDCQSLQVGY